MIVIAMGWDGMGGGMARERVNLPKQDKLSSEMAQHRS